MLSVMDSFNQASYQDVTQQSVTAEQTFGYMEANLSELLFLFFKTQ